MLVVVRVGGSIAADAGVSLDLASAYVFRGVTFNDGLVLQPGLEVVSGDFTVGVWGNMDLDDMDDTLEDSEFSEIDIYGTYALPVDALDTSIGYTEYAYPNGGVADREVSLSIGKDCLLSPSLGIYYGCDGAIEDSFYAELGLSHELKPCQDVLIELGATVGYLSSDEGKAGFSHFTTTVGVSCGILKASLTYVGQISEDVLGDAHDVELYGVLGIAKDF